MSTSERPIAIGIDAGGTHTRGVAVNASGAVLARSNRAGSNPRTVGDARGREEIRQIVTEIRQAAPGPVEYLMLGSAGLTHPATDAQNEEWSRTLGVPVVAVDSDARIAHAAAFGTGSGVVVIAGTGSQCLALGPGGERVSVGGWGPTFGDEGSANWIATTAIGQALHALDEHRSSELLAALLNHAGIAPDTAPQQRNARLLDVLYDPSAGLATHARFAPTVARLAESGDPEAHDVLGQAGVLLADMAVLAARRTGERRVSYVGSVLVRSPIVRDSFERTVLHGGLEVLAPRWEPVFGAVYLAMAHAGWDASTASAGWARSERVPANRK